jgi:YtcA family
MADEFPDGYAAMEVSWWAHGVMWRAWRERVIRCGAPRALAAVAACALAGCSSAPSRNILGSYFPSWMICALFGLGATLVVHGLLQRAGIAKEIPMPVVVYLALAVAFTLALWLVWLA